MFARLKLNSFGAILGMEYIRAATSTVQVRAHTSMRKSTLLLEFYALDVNSTHHIDWSVEPSFPFDAWHAIASILPCLILTTLSIVDMCEYVSPLSIFLSAQKYDGFSEWRVVTVESCSTYVLANALRRIPSPNATAISAVHALATCIVFIDTNTKYDNPGLRKSHNNGEIKSQVSMVIV